jgi:hypothetical protein
MKKLSEITKKQKVLVIILLFVIFISTLFYIKEIRQDDNYKTTIDCGNGSVYYFEGKEEVYLYEVCDNLKRYNYNYSIVPK